MEQKSYSYRADKAVPQFSDDKPIIVFDGYCVMCSHWANFVLRHDKHARYRLLAAQSPLGEALYAHYGLKPSDYDTNLLIENGRCRVKSDGTLAMFAGLGFPWALASIFRIIPRHLLDRVYGLIARKRLIWFGQRNSCFMPLPGNQDRFL